MQVVSAGWAAAVRNGVGAAFAAARAEIYDYQGVLLASTDVAVAPYPVLQLDDGSINVDSTAAIRRQAKVTFADPDGVFAPDSGRALLANESGNEVRLYVGFEYPDGTVEVLPQGVFGIQDDDTESPAGDQTVSLSLYDRARRIQRAKFVEQYTIKAGTNYVTAITSLLTSRWAAIQINTTPTLFTTPQLVFDTNDDPWAQAQDMASKIGYDLYFDVHGECQLNPIVATSTTAPVWDYSEGLNATILTAARRSSNEKGYNGIIMTGASSSNATPPRGEAWDTDPGSPTYSGYDVATKSFGPSAYGAFPNGISSSLLTTPLQCQAAAAAELQKTIGRREVIQFDALVNAAHDTGDVVQVTRAKAKIDALYELQSFNIPMRAGTPMTAITKERRAA